MKLALSLGRKASRLIQSTLDIPVIDFKFVKHRLDACVWSCAGLSGNSHQIQELEQMSGCYMNVAAGSTNIVISGSRAGTEKAQALLE
jgi:hypothetical protein